ncbi:hypothetical protein CHARACLAT_026319 [Characodon lateralis]|uniref:Uncharacterized protein n=1 Tax=Characodon lateralis TaxID=208331 RepID=A0ABU7E546_9TELE|nr:hypothetical protein [Characodon lateralis]
MGMRADWSCTRVQWSRLLGGFWYRFGIGALCCVLSSTVWCAVEVGKVFLACAALAFVCECCGLGITGLSAETGVFDLGIVWILLDLGPWLRWPVHRLERGGASGSGRGFLVRQCDVASLW